MPVIFNWRIAAASVAVGLLAGMMSAAAQDYPRKGTVAIVVPYGAGGTTDMQARMAAEILGKRLGGTFIVENRVGYGGNIGAEYVARARPDGYTLLLGGIAINAINPTLFANLPYSAENDFVAAAPLASGPFLLVTAPGAAYRTVASLVAAAKARPGAINYSSAGSGTGQHLVMELFRSLAGIDLQHVPYKGTPQAMTDVMSGTVPVMFNNVDTVTGHIKQGKLHALGISSAERSPTLPEVPTFVEQGYPGMIADSWVGIYVPKGTPRAIVDAVNRAVVTSMNAPETRARLAPLGLVPASQTPEEFEQWTRKERERWARIVKSSAAKPD